MGFLCTVCGEQHDPLPMSYSVKAPLAVAGIPPEEFEQRVVYTVDQCVVDGKDFYLRGRIPIPVEGFEDPFIWGVWAEVSPKSFLLTTERWSTEGREQTPPFPGWLNTNIFPFGDTFNLEVRVHTQVVGRRPHFEVVDQEHPLAIEQSHGITLQRVQQIAEMILHDDD
ncbi:DUF2199 domain-containing protein [Granulicella arctica]|uniref:DUF2199 domain-containing protein n=1 Tax=Granulicella arctica TaxID=940613 RepID=UPI0021DF4BB4|nr:DUF2199 domain-containing protein [Granulicella arctica]